MVFVKELFAIWTLVAVVAANHQYTPYHPPYSPALHYKEPSYHHHNYDKVKLHKLCSWNVVRYDENRARELYRDDSWDSCKVDAGRAYIPENNLPNAFAISECRRVFVVNPRSRSGVYSNLGYFHLDDVGKDEYCPPLKPYPPHLNHTLNAQCCTKDNLVNVNRINIDSCNRLWALDRQSLELNDRAWEQFSPRLVIYDLKTDYELRTVKLPKDMYDWQLGFKQISLNVDPHDCNKGYAYLLDAYSGCIVVYSYHEDKFWRVCTPEFASDAKYSKFHVKTRKNHDVTYYKDNFITDCTRDFKNQQLVCHSDCQLDEYVVPFADLNSEENARCAPDSLNVKYLGQKCKKCQVSMHSMNKELQVVWGVQEQNYGVGCWNRENPLTPDAVQLVVQDHHKLPYLTDLELTDVDLSHFLDHDDYHRRDHYHGSSYDSKDNYVVVLSNNYQSINEYGLDDYEENFGFYFFVEKEALKAYPQCLAQKYHKPGHYEQSYKPDPYHQPAHKPAPYHPPSYKPTHQPAYHQPAYKPAPTYAPQPSYKHPTPTYRYKKSEESADTAAEAKAE